MKKHIPNFITCLNLLSGCMAILLAIHSLFTEALLLIIAAAFFDFLDGMAARLLHAYSAIGKELDSLSDVVSFGVAPGFIVFSAIEPRVGLLPLAEIIPYAFLAFIIPVFSALRLAKFNIDERQASSFIGMPTPANALFWGSAIVGTESLARSYPAVYATVIVVLLFVFSYLLVSNLPMFSLKTKSLSWKQNEVQYLLLASAVVLISLLGWLGIAATILVYVLISVVLALRNKNAL